MLSRVVPAALSTSMRFAATAGRLTPAAEAAAAAADAEAAEAEPAAADADAAAAACMAALAWSDSNLKAAPSST
ncbi:hypothetical protein ELG61_01390 [Rhizobium leguminosarum]|nr:hypothetical protein ELG70_01380 [Rhizobium leguminosarum]TBH65103.1 hypothetical protein ELG61_01390 [Rhizobium leguminosarum]